MARFPWTTALVAGSSMQPVLADGDAVLVRRTRAIKSGDVVVAKHPERVDLLVIKRATRQLSDGRWWIEGDNQAASHDSWVFGEIDPDLIVGRVVLKYAPGFPQRVRR